MRAKGPLWIWYAVWAACILAGIALVALYTWLPADGATGDLESFRPEGFRVQWILEKRYLGLQVEDVIVRAGGHTVEEWLSGAARGPEWRSGGIVHYEILRDRQPMSLYVRLSPVPFIAVLGRWALQFVVALAFLIIGTFVFLKRPDELAARLLMFFCVVMTLQYLGDAYNFQYATLPWRWPFWVHLVFEHGMYGLGLSTIICFSFVFPLPHPVVERFPRLVPSILYGAFPLAIGGAMILSPTWTSALKNGNHASWTVAMLEVGLAFVAGIRSARHGRDPVTRAQIRWIIWCAAVGAAIMLPGYVLPLMFTGKAPLSHPVIMLVTVLIPFALAVAVLRYRLFDIRVIINRTLVYVTLSALLASLYLLLVRLLTLIVEMVWQGGNDTLVIFVATLSIALAFAPLRRRVQSLIDLTFYRTKLDYQRLLPEMSERLATSLDLDELAALLTLELPQRLRIAWAALAVLDPEEARYVLASSGERHPTLPAGHALAVYLHHSGQPLLRLQSPDDLSGEARAFLDRHGIELCIPLIVGNRLVGLYELGLTLSGDAYTGDEVRQLHLLGQQAAIAVENSRLFRATERQAEELAGLHEAAVAISSSLEIEAVLRTLAEQLGRTLDVSCVYICDLDEEAAYSTVLAEWLDPATTGRRSDVGTVYDMGQYPTSLQSLLAKQPFSIQTTDPDLDPADRASAERHGWHSILIVPLLLRDRAIGYAELWEMRQGRQFTPAEVRLCQTLAADAAAAIDHARLFQAEREQRLLTQALQEAADVVSRTLDLDQVLDRILEQVERVVAGDAFNIMLVEGNFAWVVRWRGYERLGVEEPISSLYMPVAEYPTLTAMIETGKPVVVSDMASDADWVPLKGWEWLGSYVSAPIQVTGRTVGFLNVDRVQPGQFTSADAQRLEAFAHHAATALQNARLYAETQRQLAEQTALRQAGAIISSTLDPEAVLSRIAEAMGRAVDATSAYLSSFEVDAWLATVVAEWIGPEARVEEMVSDLGVGYPEDGEAEWLGMMSSGQHAISHIDDSDLSPSERAHMEQFGAQTILYIPLLLKGQFIGYAEIWESRRRRDFTDSEIALCQAIAQQAAIALEHARLYEQAQQEIAERKRVEEQIKTSLAEKEVLLKEIHHRVKNNLQVISSLLYLQSKRIKDGETLGMFQDSQHRVRSMALVHERLYQTKDLSQVDAAEYVQTLVSYLFRSYGVHPEQIKLDVRVDGVSLGIDAAVPFGLLINELISNSLKHAFPHGRTGEVFVDLHTTQDSHYALVIGDDGVGFPGDLDFRNTESLGLQLVNTLVDQLEGSIALDSSAGTRFEIVFPNTGL